MGKRGRPGLAGEKRIRRVVLELLPPIGRVRSKELERKASAIGLTARTLYKILREFQNAEIVRRTVDSSFTPPAVYYERAAELVGVHALAQKHRKMWSPSLSKEYEGLCLLLGIFANRLVGWLHVACEKETWAEAEAYVNAISDSELSAQVLQLGKICYDRRDLKADGVPIVAYAVNEVLEEEETEKWLGQYAPKWAKRHVRTIPASWLVQILMTYPRDIAVRKISETHEAIAKSRPTS